MDNHKKKKHKVQDIKYNITYATTGIWLSKIYF